MTESNVDWLPAFVALGIGLAVGAAVAAKAAIRKARSAAAAAPADERDLVARRESLVQQLREMEDVAGKRPPGEFARERFQLELEAARVVLALEERAPAGARKEIVPETPRASPVSQQPDRSAFRGFIWGIGTAAMAAVLGLLIYQSAKPREAGGSVTGEVPGSGARGAGAPVAADPDEAGIEAALARNPEDTEARLAHARILLERRNYMGAWGESIRILQTSPGNPRALSYQALVRLEMGQGEVAVDLLRQALKTDPDLIDAYVDLARVHLRLGRTTEAERDIARAVRRFPQQAVELRGALEEMRRNEAGRPLAPAGPNPHAKLATPEGEQRPPAVAVAARGKRISGSVDIDPALNLPISSRAVLFVFVRAAGVSSGPPIAVKRLAPHFPVSFDLTEADAMLGQPFPDPVMVEARLDSDGDPLTRPPSDPTARLDGVKIGRSDLHLILRQH